MRTTSGVRFVSLFDGCGMFSEALRRCGMTCVGVSEIDKHAAAVARYHYPTTAELGDVTTATFPACDLIVGGWPCQGNSVAGLRAGLDDQRSGLFAEIIRCASSTAARWLVLENVTGLLSVNAGRDMGAVVGALAKLGYGVCWRVLNAQHFGVPQRRRRLFFVAYLGNVRRAAKVLFEPDCVRRHSGSRWAPRAGAAEGAGSGTASAGNSSPAELAAWSMPLVVDAVQITSRDNRSNPQAGDPAPTLAHWSRLLAVSAPSDPAPPRRLTPRECERLQGLPDDWTRLGRDTAGGVVEMSDTARYRMIGNGGAVPVVEWIGRRIVAVDSGVGL